MVLIYPEICKQGFYVAGAKFEIPLHERISEVLFLSYILQDVFVQMAYAHLETVNHTLSGSDKASDLEKPGHLVKPFAVIYQSALAMSHYRQPNSHLRSEVVWNESRIKMSIFLHKNSGMPIKRNCFLGEHDG